MATCVETKDLTKCFRSVVAVSGLNLKVSAGEVLGLLGPNGAGKSTTLHMLTGLVPATSGSISVFGKDLRKNRLEIARRTGVLVERPTFYDHLSARANLLFLARLARQEVAVDQALDRLGMLHVAAKRVSDFSPGMRQRLGLAHALMTEPELLVLDEPTNGLDVESAREVLELLRFLAEEAGVTVVMASHLLHEAEVLCDRVAILNRGRLVACEPIGALLSYDETEAEVLVDAAEPAAKRLDAEPWVQSVEVFPGRLRVKLDGGTVHQLTALLIGAGYTVAGVIPRRRSLQDHFLKVLES
jgi:ABC-2 type transport system ATP-binding protein